MDEPKYTAREWAIMEGGHSIEAIKPAEKPFSFINGLYEEGLVEKAKKEDKKEKDDKKELSSATTAKYGLLVGKENAVLAKRFVDLALDEKAVPASLVKAYMPAIELLNDIVDAGPSYINSLKLLHKRAKKDSK